MGRHGKIAKASIGPPQTPLNACVHFTHDSFRSPIRNLQFRIISKQFVNFSKLSPRVLVAFSRSGGKLFAVSVSKPHDFLEELSLKVNEHPFFISSFVPKIIMTKRFVRMLFALSLFSLCLSAPTNGRSSAKISLQALPGPYPVGTISLELIDHSRIDPYAPTPQPRALMVSLFYPTTDIHPQFAPYLPTALAAVSDKYLSLPAGFLESLQTQAHLNARLKEIPDIPMILFSPGLSGIREEYTTLLEGLASYGYLFIAMDHTYDGILVEFPDGTIIQGNPSLAPDQENVDVRTKDSMFVIDQLSNVTFISANTRSRTQNFQGK